MIDRHHVPGAPAGQSVTLAFHVLLAPQSAPANAPATGNATLYLSVALASGDGKTPAAAPPPLPIVFPHSAPR